MATEKQVLGALGESLVAKKCSCPRCKRGRTLKRLPNNFKCADLICDFCGYLGQVKTTTTASPEILPNTILGAAWGPQSDRMEAGIYFPLFLVLYRDARYWAIYYLSADLQHPAMFTARKPLGQKAKRAGWQGFMYNLRLIPAGGLVRLSVSEALARTLKKLEQS